MPICYNDENRYYEYFHQNQISNKDLKEILESKSDEMAKRILSFDDQGIKAVLNSVTCERIRQKWKISPSSKFLNFIIEHLYRSSVRKENDTLIDGKLKYFISKHAAGKDIFDVLRAFYSHDDVVNQITDEQLIIFIKALANYKELTALCTIFPSAHKRVRDMVLQLQEGEFHSAFDTLLRIHQLKTHEWKVRPPNKYWEFTIARRIKEMAIWQKLVFIGARLSLWEFDAHLKEREGVKKESDFIQKVKHRELGFVINEKHLAQLRAVGGDEKFLMNPDGDRLHTMEFKASDFVGKVGEVLNKIKVIDKATKKSGQEVHFYKCPEHPLEDVDCLISLGILVRTSRYALENEIRPTLDNDVKIPGEDDEVLVYYPPRAKQDDSKLPSTAIICTGSGVWFGIYKTTIARLLLNGINVVAFNYRGYEYSEGIPTDKKLFQDLETVGHYLRENNVSDEQILVYASCVGLGPAAEYIKTHPKSDLFIDRSFASFKALAVDKIKEDAFIKNKVYRFLASKIANIALPKIINFENIGKLKEAQGKIAVLTAEDDLMLGDQGNSLTSIHGAKNLTTRKGHAGNWLKEPETLFQFEEFLVSRSSLPP